MKLSEVASRIHCKLQSPADVEVTGVASLEEAGPQDLTFLSNPKYYRKAQLTQAAAIVVSEDHVKIGDDCVLKSFVAIYRGAQIGDRFLAHSHSVVRENVQIGHDVTLQNGVVVGGDGFGFAKQADESYYKILQTGTVVIEDGVEIQANSCIDRASVGVTRIRRGAKIDNLVQVGHGCEVGENTLLCGQVGLAGSTRVGRNVILAGQVGVAGHLT